MKGKSLKCTYCCLAKIFSLSKFSQIRFSSRFIIKKTKHYTLKVTSVKLLFFVRLIIFETVQKRVRERDRAPYKIATHKQIIKSVSHAHRKVLIHLLVQKKSSKSSHESSLTKSSRCIYHWKDVCPISAVSSRTKLRKSSEKVTHSKKII